MNEGQLLDDRYRLADRLSEGGVSETWQAHDELLDRAVAVKVFVADADLRGRVLREARAAAGLSHPNVAGVYDYGEMPDHGPFVVMELLRGPTLAPRLAGGPLPVGATIRICAEVAAGLAALHAADLVHGDVTPANVVLTEDAAKVGDFGILGSSSEPDDADDANEPDSLGNLDPAGDVHAFGVLLYSCLTGRLPSDESPAEVLADVEGVPADVRELCVSCLAEDPADRPAAAEVASVLAAAAGVALPDRPIRAIGIFAGQPADDVVEEFRTRSQLRLALAMSATAAVILASFLLTRDASAPQGLAGGVPSVTGPAQSDWTGEPPADPGADVGPSTGTGSEQPTDTVGSDPENRVESVGNAGRPGNATGGGGEANPVPGGTTAPPAAGPPGTTAPAAAAQTTTPALVAVRLSTLGGVVVAGCNGGKVSVLDVQPAPGAKVVSVQGGARDTARVEIDLLVVHLSLNVRCVAGLPVATPI